MDIKIHEHGDVKTPETLYLYHSPKPPVLTGALSLWKKLLFARLFPLAVLTIFIWAPMASGLLGKRAKWEVDFLDRFFPSVLILEKGEFAILFFDLNYRSWNARTKGPVSTLKLNEPGLYILKPFCLVTWKGTQEEFDHFDPLSV